jgi:hypothetical protein
VTVSDSATTSATTADGREGDANTQPRVLARARITAQTITTRIHALFSSTAKDTNSRDVRRVSPFHAPPPSLHELLRYTRSGAWVPGDQAPWLEGLGKAYGYAISLPTSAALYSFAWLLQRPTRLFLAAVVAGVVWLTH